MLLYVTFNIWRFDVFLSPDTDKMHHWIKVEALLLTYPLPCWIILILFLISHTHYNSAWTYSDLIKIMLLNCSRSQNIPAPISGLVNSELGVGLNILNLLSKTVPVMKTLMLLVVFRIWGNLVPGLQFLHWFIFSLCRLTGNHLGCYSLMIIDNKLQRYAFELPRTNRAWC